MGHQDFVPGIRFAITWLHERAKEMGDPKARQILDSAAFNLGSAKARGDFVLNDHIISLETSLAERDARIAELEASWRETLRKERDARLNEVRLKEAAKAALSEARREVERLTGALERIKAAGIRREIINGERCTTISNESEIARTALTKGGADVPS